MRIWVRNTIFHCLCLTLTGLVVARILQRPQFVEPKSFATSRLTASELQNTVHRVNEAWAAAWQNAGLTPAPKAFTLTVARRLSLALTGTIPSLEEVRAFEVRPDDERVQWWLSHLFEDRRY